MENEKEETVVLCGCKGIRSCLICEKLKGKQKLQGVISEIDCFRYDPHLGRAIQEDTEVPHSFPFPGVFLWQDFVSEKEENQLVAIMDLDPWKESQSGRRKQDFGPKVNFKKQRVHLGSFSGLPPLSHELVLRMQREPLLSSFQPVEQCNLDYSPLRGSAIDPHLDDSWLWGERLVTINLLSDTVLTMSLNEGQREIQVRVAFPRRALLMLHGEARHRWKHGILREDIQERRVCSTYRELAPEFLPGGKGEQLGAQLLDTALNFKGVPL